MTTSEADRKTVAGKSDVGKTVAGKTVAGKDAVHKDAVCKTAVSNATNPLTADCKLTFMPHDGHFSIMFMPAVGSSPTLAATPILDRSRKPGEEASGSRKAPSLPLHAEVRINPVTKALIIRPCSASSRFASYWPAVDNYYRIVQADEFSKRVYAMMGWNLSATHSIAGWHISSISLVSENGLPSSDTIHADDYYFDLRKEFYDDTKVNDCVDSAGMDSADSTDSVNSTVSATCTDSDNSTDSASCTDSAVLLKDDNHASSHTAPDDIAEVNNT